MKRVYFWRNNENIAIALFMHKANPTLWTCNSSIFIVITVVDTNSIMRATTQDCLISTAAHIVQEDGSSSRRKGAIVVLISDCYCICTNWFAAKWNKVTNTMHLCRLPINSNWSIVIEQSGCMGTPTYSLSLSLMAPFCIAIRLHHRRRSRSGWTTFSAI